MADKDNHSLIVQNARMEVKKFERGVLDKLTPEKIVKTIITCCPEGCVDQVAFTPDGQFLAVCIDRSVLLWDLKLGRWIQKFVDSNMDRVKHIEITPDGGRLISGDDYKVIEWDLKTGRTVRRISINRIFAVMPDSKTLVAQDHINYPFNRIGIWDLESGEKIRAFSFTQKWHSTAMTLSPDGTKVAVAEFVSNFVRIYDVGSEGLIFTLKGHSGCVNALAFTPDGEVLISGSDDQMIRFWRMMDGACFRVMPGHSKQVYCLAVSPDGKRLLSGGGDKMIHVWDLRGERLQQTLFEHERTIKTLAVSPDGRMAASGGYDEKVYLWNLASGKVLDTLKATTGCASRIACTPAGKLIASFSKDMRTLDLRKFTEDGHCRYGKIIFGEDRKKASVAIHPEGTDIAVGMLGRVCLYDAQTGLRKKAIGGFGGYVKFTAFSPDGEVLLAGSCTGKQGTWCIYNLHSGESTYKHYGESKGQVLMKSIAFLPDGASFLAVRYDRFELWRLETGMRERVVVEAPDLYSTRAVAVHPSGETFVTGGQLKGEIHAWDLETGAHLRTFTEHTRRITALTFSPDGKLLLSGCEGGIVNYWDYETGRLLATAHNVDKGYLWTTPPDEFTDDGWLYTDRTDLLSLAAIDSNTGDLEYLNEGDERVKNYMRIYNDGEMVMTRIYNWERYLELLRLRTGSKEGWGLKQIEASVHKNPFYLPKPKA